MRKIKGIFCVILAFAMLLQISPLVFAETDTTDVDTYVRLQTHSTSDAFSEKSITKSGSETFDYRVNIKMANVLAAFKQWYGQMKTLVGTFTVDETEKNNLLEQLKNTEIKGEFVIEVEIDKGISASGENHDKLVNFTAFDGSNITDNMYGFNEESLKHFRATSKTFTEGTKTNKLVVKIEPYHTGYQNADNPSDPANSRPLTLGDLEEEYDTEWADLIFTARDVTVATSANGGRNSDGNFHVSVNIPRGYTASKFVYGDKTPWLHITYNFNDADKAAGVTNPDSSLDNTVTVKYRRTGGGGGGLTTRYTITFNVDGDTKTVAPITKARNTTIKLSDLTIPHKDGYTFDGWYLDEAKTNKITSEFKLTQNITVYGSWKKNDIDKGHSRLNTTDHFAYVVGYPDGTVKPNQNITREEIGVIFFRLMKDDYRSTILTKSNNFSDVDSSRWSNTGISTMANGKYIVGYEDGSFGPGRNITRAEFAAIAARFDDETPDSATHTFTDISGHWAEDYIARAVQRGWIAGYEDGTFRPDQNITRAEAMTIINRMLNRFVNAQGLHADAILWTDNPKDAWYYYAVEEATNSHDYTRQADGVNETWTRITENRDWSQFER